MRNLKIRTFLSLIFLLGSALPLLAAEKTLSTTTYEINGNSNLVDGAAWYDLDGDGTMSIVTRETGYPYNCHIYSPDIVKEYTFYEDEIYGSSGHSSSYIKWIYRTLDYDNTSTPTIFFNDKAAFKYDGNGGFVRADAPQGYLLLDADNNGSTDILTADDTDLYINYRQSDGSYLKTKLRLTTNREDVYNATYEYSTNWGDNIPSLSDGWMQAGVVSPTSYTNITLAADLNHDGIPDLIDNAIGGILYNIDDNTYYTSPESGAIYQCDLNGDGILDFVLFDDSASKVYLMVYQPDGSYSQQLLIENAGVSKVWYHDFDHDGDIDLLLPIDYDSRVGFCLLVYFINDGNGEFRRREISFTDKQYEFIDCYDVDADGLYEVLAHEQDTNNTVLLDCENSYTSFTEIVLTERYNADNFTFGDIDNDGFTECYYNYGSSSINKTTGFGDRQNTAPAKMAAPVAYYDDASGKLRITWEAGSDAETSACDLTYELRIGTAPGKADILAINSLPDGRRRTLVEGNMGRNLYNLFGTSAMAEGTYYIAVQAIDAAGLGGAWSSEAIYNHRITSAEFSISHCEMTTSDTLRLAARKIDGAIYKWNTADGTVINNDGNRAEVAFSSYGEREIGLTITLADGSTLTANPKTVDVLMFKNIYDLEDLMPYKYGDFNFDGYIDGLGGGWSYMEDAGMFANDGKGTFTKVAKLYNTDLKYTAYGILDFNKDGYLDFMANEDKGNMFINSGFDDFSFEYSKKEHTINNSTSPYPVGQLLGDMNNDGYPEWFYDNSKNNGSYMNMGDNLTFTYVKELEITDPDKPDQTRQLSNLRFYDINRDGFIDAIAQMRKYWNENDDEFYIYAFIKDPTGDFSFEDEKLMFKIKQTDDTAIGGGWLYGDLNSDGYIDLFYRITGENFIRVIPGKPMSEWPCTDEVRIPLVGDYDFSMMNSDAYYQLHDFDNNGYPDIPIEAKDPAASEAMPTQAILLMQPGFKAELCRINGSYREATLPFIALSDGAYPQVGNGSRTHGKTDNQAPERPANVMAKQNADGLLITWADAKDDHTQAAQMRYNVSVKKKGATGNGSFLISPMNALSDNAAIVPSYMYKQSTRMTVPAEFLEAGLTYEVQIQAIDAFNEHSPMTSPVEISINAAGRIDAADKVACGAETALKYVGTQATSFSYDLDGGTLVADKGNGEITAKWDEPGVKNITLTAGNITINSAITVVDLLDVSFDLPTNLLASAPVVVKVPEAMLDNSRECGFNCDDERVDIAWSMGDSTAIITFSETGTYTIESYIDNELQSNTCRRQTVVTDIMPVAEISSVTADASGHYAICWNTTGMPQNITKVIISRETNRLNKYAIIGETNLQDGTFIDTSSSTDTKSERYTISLVADNWQQSYDSDPHKPLHVMINIAAAGGYNLMWNSYEGVEVDYYTIMRGPSPSNLVELTQIPGSQQNYTDVNAPEGELYYAVTFTPTADDMLRAKATGKNTTSVSSNVVSTSEAITAIYATSMQILSVEPVMELTREQGSLHLFAEMQPLSATFNRVAWEIIEGTELATINANGLLEATGNGAGNVVVRATALDGSGLTATATITCEEGAISSTELLNYNDGNWQLHIANSHGNLSLSGWNDGDEATLYIVSMNGTVMKIARTREAQTEIDCSGYASGVYVVKAIAGGEAKAVKFVLK